MAQNFNIACSSVFCEYALVLSKQNLGHTGNENVAHQNLYSPEMWG